MKKRVLVLTNLMFLAVVGCSSNNSESVKPSDTTTSSTVATTNTNTSNTPKPTVIKNRSKGGILNSDIKLNALFFSAESNIKNLPLTINYASNEDGLLNLNSGETAVEINADLTKANAYQEGDTQVSSTDASINNINAFKTLVNVQDIFKPISMMLPSGMFSSLPGQYKALGYEFSKMSDSLSKATDKADALQKLGSEKLTCYLNSSSLSFGEVHSDGNKEQARAYSEIDYDLDQGSSFIDTITEVIGALQELDISEIQKLDFVGLIDNITNGDIISDETNESIRNAYEQIKKVTDIFVGGVNIEKTGKTNDDGTIDAGFNLYLNNYGLEQLGNTVVDLVKGIDGVPSIAATLLEQLHFSKFNIGIDLYKGKDEYTHFGGFNFDFEFYMGETPSDETSSHINIAMDVNHEDGSKIDDSYFNALETKNSHYKDVANQFETYYAEIGKSVEYFDGDYDSSSLDITLANGLVFDTAINQYDSLSDDVKFMLTDAIKKDEIKNRYQEGRKALSDNLTKYKAEKTKTMDKMVTDFKDASAYLNWKEALNESDTETYQAIETMEENEIKSVEDSLNSYLTTLKGMKIDASDSEITAAVKTNLNSLRSKVGNYKPSTNFLGMEQEAKYSDNFLFNQDLIDRKDTFLSQEKDSIGYKIETEAQKLFVSHLDVIMKNDTLTSKKASENFNSLVKDCADNFSDKTALMNQDDAKATLHDYATEQLKTDYLNKVTPYLTEAINNVIDAYTKLKNDNNVANKLAWTTAVATNRKVTQDAASNELKLFGTIVSQDSYDTMNHIIALGNKLVK